MAAPSKTRALILKRAPWREHDLRVEALGEDTGRLSLIALAARKSQRRFGAALETGAQVMMDLNLSRRRLNGCDLIKPIDRIRGDLARFGALSYVLEIALRVSSEGEADPQGYALIVEIIDALESGAADFEALVRWDLRMLRHHGYALRWGGLGEALSLEGGGIVQARAPLADKIQLPKAAIEACARLDEGGEARFELGHRRAIRGALIQTWGAILNGPLITAKALLSAQKSLNAPAPVR
ncbi:DNA repair protein RecO [Myxococcota bacterium]|nr:DNA repair protein RecO [Myxococcota bacterium]MBU1431573.1 DNA repair protein RecO [Myxococcota bacterium]MBU1897374.1 DNA repair protein RecO [Myxococcota bacterium]